MPLKGQRRRREPHRRHHQSQSNPRDLHPEELPLIQGLRLALRSPDPVDLLQTVSSIMVIAAASPSGSTVASIAESFMGTPLAETTAALTAIRSLTSDEALRESIDDELGRRRHPMPGWLARLDEARNEPDVWFLTHVQGDGDDYLFGLVTGTGEPVTALVYVDHNLGSIVKDAFLIPMELSEVVIEMGLRLDSADQSLAKVDPATARAAVEAAIKAGLHHELPLESETWPGCRVAVEWMLRMLPEGGSPPEVRAWSEEDAEALAQEFLASELASGLDGGWTGSVVRSLIEFGRAFVTRDPLTWSPVSVEMVMEWFPRAVIAPAEAMLELPDVLRAFIRFADTKKGVREELTQGTVEAVSHWEPLLVSDVELRRSEAQLTVMQAWQGGEISSGAVAPIFLAGLERAVGGSAALMALDDEPLPDEPFNWAGIADDIRPAVEEILTSLDTCSDDLLDVEHRTAMRRLLARAMASDPRIVRRASKHAPTAAAVAWLVASANDSLGQYNGQLKAKDLAAPFGLAAAPSDKVALLLDAIGVDSRDRFGRPYLETPDLLVARFRRTLMQQRDRWLELAEDLPDDA